MYVCKLERVLPASKKKLRDTHAWIQFIVHVHVELSIVHHTLCVRRELDRRLGHRRTRSLKMFVWLTAVAALLLPSRPAPAPHRRAVGQRTAVPLASESPPTALARIPDDAVQLLQLARELSALEAAPLALAQLTDAIEYPIEGSSASADTPIASVAHSLKRWRRGQLLVDLLKTDRAAYLETVSFLNIPRDELPNRQDVPLRPFDSGLRNRDSPSESEALVDGLNADGLVPDCALQDKQMGENAAEAGLLEITRNIYAEETGVARVPEKGIRGLLEEMRRYMLSPRGASPEAQQEVLIRTLRVLMTPVLPPFYRIFMGGIVPAYDPDDRRIGANPKWLADAFQWLRARLPIGKEYLEPGRQLGPWFYAPTLTAVVAPYAFGFLVGPSRLNLRSDGQYGGLVVEKCKFLQESNCKGMCLNSCKQPAQQLFTELGLPLRVSPNFETQECQWSFGEPAPPPAEDPTWPKGCIVGCTSREAMRELSGGGPVVRACE